MIAHIRNEKLSTLTADLKIDSLTEIKQSRSRSIKQITRSATDLRYSANTLSSDQDIKNFVFYHLV